MHGGRPNVWRMRKTLLSGYGLLTCACTFVVPQDALCLDCLTNYLVHRFARFPECLPEQKIHAWIPQGCDSMP